MQGWGAMLHSWGMQRTPRGHSRELLWEGEGRCLDPRPARGGGSLRRWSWCTCRAETRPRPAAGPFQTPLHTADSIKPFPKRAFYLTFSQKHKRRANILKKLMWSSEWVPDPPW